MDVNGKARTNGLVVKCVLIAVLLIALGDQQYGYYQFVRWFSFVAFLYLLRINLVAQRETWAWVFGALALLYNPVIPFALGRQIWEVANAATIAIAVISIYVETKRPTE